MQVDADVAKKRKAEDESAALQKSEEASRKKAEAAEAVLKQQTAASERSRTVLSSAQ